MTDAPPLPPLVTGLLQPRAYPHASGDIRLLETHISWVILTGELAYKVKKPVNFGFLDFSTLDKRRQTCVDEVRLNRRLAGQLYEAAVPIAMTADGPMVGAEPAAEYAVRMQQFDPEQGLNQLLAAGQLDAAVLDKLAEIIAAFHRDAARAADDQPWGRPTTVLAPMKANFQHIRPVLDAADREELDRLEHWTEATAAHLGPVIEQRERDGRIRECHGDLHLGNIVLRDGRPLVFDCIEFSPQLRWLDVINELAFTTMDLDHAGRPELAWRYLNQYLEHSGDYAGLALLRFYQVYRALVRAKVAALRAGQESPEDARDALSEVDLYLHLAGSYTKPGRPALIITHGLSGSGKTTITNGLLERIGAVRLRSDVERKRLFGLSRDEDSAAQDRERIYGAEASRATYARLGELVGTLLGAGFTVIVEATFLREAYRQAFRALADEVGVPFLILDLQARPETLIARVAHRAEHETDASEADVAVLKGQIDGREPPSAAESGHTVVIDTEAGEDIGQLSDRVLDAIAGQTSRK